MRETKTIITPLDGHKVEILTYVTGREQREINSAVYNSASIDVQDGQPVIQNIQASQIVQAVQDKTVEMLIVGINDSNENILDRLLDMKSRDYDFVIQALNEVTAGHKKK